MRKGKTIAEVVNDNLCTGCGTCVALCPLSAIDMVKDDYKGVYVPKLDKEKCNQCGICYQVCPGHSIDFKQLNQDIFSRDPDDFFLGNYLNCYIGYATDYDIRYNSSSGGIVTSLLVFALEEGLIDGALVTRMKKDKPLEPEPFIARTKDEIISAARSKYCPVPANIALKEILETDGKYAVVGLPCHLHGIRKAEIVNKKLKDSVVLHVGIFCAKTISFRGTEDLLHRKGIHKEEIEELNYRGNGYPGGMLIKLRNGSRSFIALSDYYDTKFGLFPPLRCTLCYDHSSELTDISLGDAWLPEVKMNDKIGTSIIVSRTKQAEAILGKMVTQGKIHLNIISAFSVYESQHGFANKKKRLMARFTVSRLFGKKIPTVNYPLSKKPSFYDYLASILLYFGIFLASKRSLWWPMDIYSAILSYGSSIKKRINQCRL